MALVKGAVKIKAGVDAKPHRKREKDKSKMKKWGAKFWEAHGDRLIYMLLAFIAAAGIYNLDMKDEAKTIFIGLAMLCYHKARGTDTRDK